MVDLKAEISALLKKYCQEVFCDSPGFLIDYKANNIDYRLSIFFGECVKVWAAAGNLGDTLKDIVANTVDENQGDNDAT